MNVVIIGANGATGRLLVAAALAEGHAVTAVTRHPADFPIVGDRLTVAGVDVADAASVDRILENADVVLSTLGVPFGRKPITTYSVGIVNIIEGMKNHGVKRLVVVSSSSTDLATRFTDSGGGFFFEKILKPIIIKQMGRTLYEDMLRMEIAVRESALDWTIVRPSGLFATEFVTDYVVEAEHVRGQYTSRADLADFLLRQATDESWIGRAVAIATLDPQPSAMQLIRQEALKK